MTEHVTFSFGRNWERYLDEMPAGAIEHMATYVADWLGQDLSGKRLVDIGSGQGLTSLVTHEAGASVVSIDLDPASVLRRRAYGSAQESHRTGRYGRAAFLMPPLSVSSGHSMSSCPGASSTTPGTCGARSTTLHHLSRRAGNSGSPCITAHGGVGGVSGQSGSTTGHRRPIKPLFRGIYAAPKIVKMAAKRDFSPITRYGDERGMTWWRDIEDWLGGLPYQVAGPGRGARALAATRLRSDPTRRCRMGR